MRKQILQIGLLLFLASGMLPCLAQTDEHPAAGKDFYFTLFNHWNHDLPDITLKPSVQRQNGNAAFCGLMLNAVEDADITFSSKVGLGDLKIHMDRGFSTLTSLQTPEDAILKTFRIHSTGACYINVLVQGIAGYAQTAILPKHLLGTNYMLQSCNGIDAIAPWTTTPRFSQFTIIGTEDATTVILTAKSALTCLTEPYTGQTISAGENRTFNLNDGEVLHFRTMNYWESISGTLVHSTRPIAVFQGNDLTCNPDTDSNVDYTWEQARPTSAWGKEFAIPKSAKLRKATYLITALENNTEILLRTTGSNMQNIGTLQAGETLERGTNPLRPVHMSSPNRFRSLALKPIRRSHLHNRKQLERKFWRSGHGGNCTTGQNGKQSVLESNAIRFLRTMHRKIDCQYKARLQYSAE